MKPSRPLKILTLDGGGLQALETLSSLNAVCRAIAKQNGAERPPAPHELFDIIAGIGTGGWLALLIGRYRLDLATATSIYMEVASKADETSTISPERRHRLFKLDQNRLATVVDEVFQRYGLDSATMRNVRTEEEGHQPSKCQHSFAAAVVLGEDKHAPNYQLLRTYPRRTKATRAVLPGPDPTTLQITDVFAATGAAKFFLKPCTIGNVTFFDENFPQTHPISSIALDEAMGLYGEDVEICVLLNIGPGIPADRDCQELDAMSLSPISRLARRISWSSSRGSVLRQVLMSTGAGDPELAEKESALISPSAMALKLECWRREDLRDRLERLYGSSGGEIYHHLGPAYSAELASLNDVNALGQSRHESADLRKQAEAEAQDMVRRVWVNAAS